MWDIMLALQVKIPASIHNDTGLNLTSDLMSMSRSCFHHLCFIVMCEKAETDLQSEVVFSRKNTLPIESKSIKTTYLDWKRNVS